MDINVKNLSISVLVVVAVTTGVLYLQKKTTKETLHKEIQTPVDLQNGLNAKLQSLIDHQREALSLPGLSVSISLPESQAILNYTSGNRTLNGNDPINPETPFQIASLTKTYISTLMLTLEAKELVNLNDTIGAWLDDYPKWKSITVKQLLNHTSGLPEIGKSPNFWENVVKDPSKIWTLKSLADTAYEQTSGNTQDPTFNYSNTNYIVIGLIIEQATGKSVKENLSKLLMGNKLNTPNTAYYPDALPAMLQSTIAHGYNQEGTFPENTDVTNVTAAKFGPASNMVSTPNDIVKFLRLLFSNNILPEKQLKEMMSLVDEKDGKDIPLISTPNNVKEFSTIGAGLGIGLVYVKNAGFQWMHSGGILGYESLYAYNPCKNIIVALSYNARPKNEFTFMKIFSAIDDTLTKSHIVNDQVNRYIATHTLPAYCTPTKEIPVTDSQEK